jgi:hypothetical protein
MRDNKDHRDAKGGLRRLRRPQLLTYAAVLAVAAILPVAGAASGGKTSLAKPGGLQTFKLKKGDHFVSASRGQVASFTRTPSFAWNRVRGATHYEFELSTSDNFRAENGMIWRSKTLTTPATAIPLSLPWITGEPASLYWHVRALGPGGAVSGWSSPRPFDMRWGNVPRPLPGGPGYVRWSTVDGATGYQVWFVRPNKVIGTITNVADEREYYAFHDNASWTGDVEWRVRAVRHLYGEPLDALPTVTYGPWSTTYHSVNPTEVQSGDVTPIEAVSDRVSTRAHPQLHSLMPAFHFRGSGDTNFGLHRIYVFSDRDCVNVVYRGAVVGGPAYAPRTSGPLDLPKTFDDLIDAPSRFLADGDEGKDTYTRDAAVVRTTEALATGDNAGSSSNGSSSAGGAPAAANSSAAATPKVDLWDRSWPGGRYYWTAVPVRVDLEKAKTTSLTESVLNGEAQITLASNEGVSAGTKIVIGDFLSDTAIVTKVVGDTATLSTPLLFSHGAGSSVQIGGKVVYRETELPQDACAAGRVLSFGKDSAEAKPADPRSVPYATGLSPNGRLLTARHVATVFYGPPLVAWTAAPAAQKYDVEWSHTKYPWRPSGHLQTAATSAVLPLRPGKWWYHVRGINESVPGNQKMTWSKVSTVRIALPTFSVRGG